MLVVRYADVRVTAVFTPSNGDQVKTVPLGRSLGAYASLVRLLVRYGAECNGFSRFVVDVG